MDKLKVASVTMFSEYTLLFAEVANFRRDFLYFVIYKLATTMAKIVADVARAEIFVPVPKNQTGRNASHCWLVLKAR